MRAFSKLIDMQIVGLDTQQYYYFFWGGGQNIKSHQRVRVVTPLLCNFHSTSFSSAAGAKNRPALGIFLPPCQLLVSVSQSEAGMRRVDQSEDSMGVWPALARESGIR